MPTSPAGAFLVFLLLSSSLSSVTAWNTPHVSNRRSLFRNILSSSAAILSPPFQDNAAHASATTTSSSSLLGYKVIPDTSEALLPSLTELTNSDFILSLSQSTGALWLGEHHNSQRDHSLQVSLIRSIHSLRRNSKLTSQDQPPQPMAIGLEQVQKRFQPMLDDYIARRRYITTDDDLRRAVQWDERWKWPFEVYREIFHTARELQIPLIALNVNSEDLALVETGGFPNMSREMLREYIPDAEGFARFAQPVAYGCYVDYVIAPSYDMHRAMGLLRYTNTGVEMTEEMSFRNFFSGRILWDECMAVRAFRWSKENLGGLIVGLVGADHVKFSEGIPGRYDRMSASFMVEDGKGTSKVKSTSVMLNPSLIDTRPSGTVTMAQNSYSPDAITLQLRYTKDGVDRTSPERMKKENFGGVLPLADYIVVSR